MNTIRWYISFSNFKIFEIQSHRVPSCICRRYEDETFNPVNIDILFLHKICQLLVCNLFCFQSDTSLVPISKNKSRKTKFQLSFRFLSFLIGFFISAYYQKGVLFQTKLITCYPELVHGWACMAHAWLAIHCWSTTSIFYHLMFFLLYSKTVFRLQEEYSAFVVIS